MSHIIVLQGPPAAGKSTEAKKLHDLDKNNVIICRDSIRESRGNYWIPEQEAYISAIEEFEVREAIKQGLNPIIDATNLNPKTIQKWESIAKETGSTIQYKECLISFEEACKRDKERGNKVGEEVILQFFKKYYPSWLPKDSCENRFMQPLELSRPKAIICDVDSVLALRTDRLDYDYSSIENDEVDFRMTHLLKSILSACEYDIFFVTARPDTEYCKRKTIEWLTKHFYPQYWYNQGIPEDNWHIYFLNPAQDLHTKEDIYVKKIRPWFDVVTVFDNLNTENWRKLGLLCLSSN